MAPQLLNPQSGDRGPWAGSFFSQNSSIHPPQLSQISRAIDPCRAASRVRTEHGIRQLLADARTRPPGAAPDRDFTDLARSSAARFIRARAASPPCPGQRVSDRHRGLRPGAIAPSRYSAYQTGLRCPERIREDQRGDRRAPGTNLHIPNGGLVSLQAHNAQVRELLPAVKQLSEQRGNPAVHGEGFPARPARKSVRPLAAHIVRDMHAVQECAKEAGNEAAETAGLQQVKRSSVWMRTSW